MKRRTKRKKSKKRGLSKALVKNVVLALVVALALVGFSVVSRTLAYYSDSVLSQENSFSAGTLDFNTSGLLNFSEIMPGMDPSASFILNNSGTIDDFSYLIKAEDATGDLCGSLQIEDGSGIFQLITSYSSATTTFSVTSAVSFSIRLTSFDSILQQKNCNLNLSISAWQTDFPDTSLGFSAQHKIILSVSSGKWVPDLKSPRNGATINGTRVKQSWAPVTGATKYIYQSCNNDPSGGSCQQRWYEEYSQGTPQFAQTSKWASGVANASYWWRVKAVFGSYESSWSDAWKIIIDNSHSNKVVLNEFLPNPEGDDDAPMPAGEFVELYNNKGEDVDINGWYLYDASDDYGLEITSGNTNTHGTIIKSGDFLVVYRNGNHNFSLNNEDGDTVRVFNGVIGAGNLVDSYSYSLDAPENKSFGRYPDGSNNWVDPYPTPGEPNNSDVESASYDQEHDQGQGIYLIPQGIWGEAEVALEDPNQALGDEAKTGNDVGQALDQSEEKDISNDQTIGQEQVKIDSSGLEGQIEDMVETGDVLQKEINQDSTEDASLNGTEENSENTNPDDFDSEQITNPPATEQEIITAPEIVPPSDGTGGDGSSGDNGDGGNESTNGGSSEI